MGTRLDFCLSCIFHSLSWDIHEGHPSWKYICTFLFSFLYPNRTANSRPRKIPTRKINLIFWRDLLTLCSEHFFIFIQYFTLFDAIIDEFVLLISHSEFIIVYRNATDFCISMIFYSATSLYSALHLKYRLLVPQNLCILSIIKRDDYLTLWAFWWD